MRANAAPNEFCFQSGAEGIAEDFARAQLRLSAQYVEHSFPD
jgi:hypothetical protein